MVSSRAFRDWRHARLLLGARAGDAEAFQRLYREIFPVVSRYVWARLEATDDAENVIALIFHRFLDRLERYDRDRGSVLSWVLSMAHNAVIDQVRSRREVVPLETIGELADAIRESPLALVLQSERLRHLQALIEELPGEARDMLRLRFEQDLGHRDIAIRMNLTEAAVKKRFSRLYRELRDGLVREEDGKEDARAT